MKLITERKHLFLALTWKNGVAYIAWRSALDGKPVAAIFTDHFHKHGRILNRVYRPFGGRK